MTEGARFFQGRTQKLARLATHDSISLFSDRNIDRQLQTASSKATALLLISLPVQVLVRRELQGYRAVGASYKFNVEEQVSVPTI